ncbi:MAG: ABC transporter ATP-binding protein [Thaumarchaeota archaeon]|nr:ABC transporter ATP-binding protein [Nitrososphaerota archaeon]
MPFLEAKNLTVNYTSRFSKVTALDSVSVSLPSHGYTLGVVGESGSGKTTFGMCLLNAIEPPGKIVDGVVEYMGKNVITMTKSELMNYRWKEISMIYQSAMNSLNPVKNISQPIAEVIRNHDSTVTRHEANATAIRLLTEVGIKSDRVKDFPHQFSGGMRQRVVIALALALSPKILIADEPTSALDVVVQRQILSLLKREITKKGLSLIFITHEISLLSGLVENVIVMYAGEIVESGPLSEVLSEPMHPYAEMLLSTIPSFEKDRAVKQDIIVEGELDSQFPLMNACKYANRCKYVFDRCKKEKPLLKEAKKGRSVACHKY